MTVLPYTHKIRLHFSPMLFLTGIHRLRIINKGRPAFPRADNCQGQLKTPQSMTVPFQHSVKFLNTCIPSKQIEIIQSNATMYFGVTIKDYIKSNTPADHAQDHTDT
jgi:hypothetical protein